MNQDRKVEEERSGRELMGPTYDVTRRKGGLDFWVSLVTIKEEDVIRGAIAEVKHKIVALENWDRSLLNKVGV